MSTPLSVISHISWKPSAKSGANLPILKLTVCGAPNGELTWSSACSISTSLPPSGVWANVSSPKKLNLSPRVPAEKRFASCGNWKSLRTTCLPSESWLAA